MSQEATTSVNVGVNGRTKNASAPQTEASSASSQALIRAWGQVQPESTGIPAALKHFDSLPDSAHVRQPVVEALFGYSASTVWRRVNSGALPKPEKLGPRTTAWNVGKLRRALRGEAA
jgi:predicted DNA-binding transcriptional regulator AlpA